VPCRHSCRHPGMEQRWDMRIRFRCCSRWGAEPSGNAARGRHGIHQRGESCLTGAGARYKGNRIAASAEQSAAGEEL